MTAPKVTQCPECSAAFRITQKQLEAAGGSVRCGSCLFIFNAYSYLDAPDNIKSQERTSSKPSPTIQTEKHAGVIVRKKNSKTPVSSHLHGTPQKNASEAVAPTLFALENNADLIQKELEKKFPEKKVFNRKQCFIRLGWGSLISLLIALLVIQFALFNKNTLALDTKYRDLYIHLCQHLNCSLPPVFNIDHIRSLDLIVQQHPEKNNVLLVDAVIISESSYPQPFPLIALTFSDINGKVIAGRVMRPDEYLGGELTGTRICRITSPSGWGWKLLTLVKKQSVMH